MSALKKCRWEVAVTEHIWNWSPPALRSDSPCPTLGQSTAKPAGLLAGPDLASPSGLPWGLHAYQRQGTVQVYHGKGNSVWGSGLLGSHLCCTFLLRTQAAHSHCFSLFRIKQRNYYFQLSISSIWTSNILGHLLLGMFTFKIRPSGCGPKAFHVCAALTTNSSNSVTLIWCPETHLSCDHCYIDTENWVDG